MIGKLDNKRRKKWPEHLGAISHAYNATRSQITRYSPYFLMFGCRPWLPIDLLFLISQQLPQTKGMNEYVKTLHGCLREAIKFACVSADREAARHKRPYNCRAGVIDLHPGDQVLVRLDSYRGVSHKLKNRWGSSLHTVVGRIVDDVPTYDQKRERQRKGTPLGTVAPVVISERRGGRPTDDSHTTNYLHLLVRTGVTA